MRTTTTLLIALAAAVALTGCALRSPSIADLQHNPTRYHDRTVTVNGVVTSSWGIPLLPFRAYRVADGTGEVLVLSQGRRTPTRGSQVRVRGRVNDIGVLGGRALGLHIREQSLQVRRR